MPLITDNPIFKKQPLVRVSPEECLKNYKMYVHPKFKRNTKKNNNKQSLKFRKTHKALATIEGMKIETKDIKEPVLLEPYYQGNSFFNNGSYYIVPKGYNEVELTKEKKDELKKSICKKPSKKIINLEKKGLYWEVWKEEVWKKWLTIEDIQKLKKGQEIKVLTLHRNIDDYFETDKQIKPNKVYKPKTFFNRGWAVYKHDKDLKGQIFYDWQNKPVNFEKNKNNITSSNSKKYSSSTFREEDIHDPSKPYDFEE